MILGVILVFGLPFIFAIFMLQHEGRNLYFELQNRYSQVILAFQILFAACHL